MPEEEKHKHDRLKICVSGAAEVGHCGLDAYEKAKAVGREIARTGCVLTNGATTGFPLWSAMGAKEEGGFTIGFSPASTEREHVDVYHLPIDYLDVIVYTGFGYSGRNLILTRSSDAVVIGCGRIGTINEFTVAYDDRRPVGILEGSWKTDEVIKFVIDNSYRSSEKIIFDADPKQLIEKLLIMVRKDKIKHPHAYANQDGVGGAAAGDRVM